MWSRLLFATSAALAVSFALHGASAQEIYGSEAYKRYQNRLSQPTLNQPSYDPNVEIENRLRKLGVEPNRHRGQGPPANQPLILDTATTNSMLRRFDKDGNGMVSQQEFMAGGERNKAGAEIRNRKNRTRLKTQFRALDRDGNGHLSSEELGAIRGRGF